MGKGLALVEAFSFLLRVIDVDNIQILNPLENGTLQNIQQFLHSSLSKEDKQIVVSQTNKN